MFYPRTWVGAMFWAVDTDDFKGKCGSKFTLISAVAEELNGGPMTPPPDWTTPDPDYSPSTPEPVTPPPSEFRDSPGAKPSPSNCHEYYTCNIGSNGWVIRPQTCGDLAFNPATGNCDWPYNVPGCDEGTTMGKIGFTFILVSLVVSLMLHLYPLLFPRCYICIPCCFLDVLFVSLVVSLILYLYPLLFS